MSEQRLIDANKIIECFDPNTWQGDMMIAIAKGLPTIEPKRGEWIEMRNPYDELEGWIHEECGFSDTCAFNYCPNCGADMRKGTP